MILTFAQKVVADNHDQNIVDKAKEINKKVKEKQAAQKNNIDNETGSVVVDEEPLCAEVIQVMTEQNQVLLLVENLEKLQKVKVVILEQ